MLTLLAGDAALWPPYGATAKRNQELHFDMGEVVAWPRAVSLGTPRHPPLPLSLVRVRFGRRRATGGSSYAFLAPYRLLTIAGLAAREDILIAVGDRQHEPRPVVLLSSPQLTISRLAVRRTLALAIAMPLIARVFARDRAAIHRQDVP